MGKTGKKFEALVKVVQKLRRDCPWDKKQTHASLKPYMLEETYEAFEAIDRCQPHKLAEELGDMLLHILMHATFAKEEKKFTIEEVIDHIKDKMIRRHPHVFGKRKTKSIKEIWSRWERIKRQESSFVPTFVGTSGDKKKRGILDGIPSSLPALLRADKVQKRAARVGFDWDQVAGAWRKVKEELGEINALLKTKGKREKRIAKLKEELGDLLFAITNVARKLEIDAEDALQKSTDKFKRRFAPLEKALQGKKLSQHSSLPY